MNTSILKLTEEQEKLVQEIVPTKARKSLQSLIYEGKLTPEGIDTLRQKCRWEKEKGWTLAQKSPHLWGADEVGILAELVSIDPRKLVMTYFIGYSSVTLSDMDSWSATYLRNKEMWDTTFKEAYR